MDTSHWNEICSLIAQSIDSVRYETWIKPLEFLSTDESNCIVLAAQNSFIADFLDLHYKDLIISFSKKVVPLINTIRFEVRNNNEESTSFDKKEKISIQVPLKEETSYSYNLNTQYTFDLFVPGPSNEFAKSAAIAVSENPGKTKFNPLLIYGGVGLGKTHLLHAIGNQILKKKTNASVNFITSEEFYFNFIDAIKNSNTKSFSDKFRQTDVLLVDDIQFIAGKERTQEEFFYLFNTLYQNGKQIVLSSDQPPQLIRGLHDRLVSRFQWGLCVDIQPPDLETRLAILKKKSERDHLSIPENILYFIAENITNNVRKLEGILIRLLAFSSISKTDITINLVKNLLGASLKKDLLKISIDTIIEKVSEYYKIPVNNIREKNRSKEVAHCRMVAMYIAKNYTNYSLKTIGLHFGGRDHSTVIHAIKHIEKTMITDTTLTNDIYYINSELNLK